MIKDGLATEAMSTLTGGTFLVALALQLGASNFQIGLLAALPTLTNVFQLLAVWLVQKYNNRKAVTVATNFFARFPLLAIGSLPFLFSAGTTIYALIFLLFFHHLFGSVAGASWNSWMKDLVPEERLGSYFSNRNRLTQTLNVVVSLLLALILELVKKYYPGNELLTHSSMFLLGGLLGLIGTYLLTRTPEPVGKPATEKMMKLLSKPLKDVNFRRLLLFNSSWSFALNLAVPFLTVYMLNTVGLPLSYVIGFGILGQFAGILAIRVWGKYSDKYSNKTMILIAAPIYIICILGWSMVSIPHSDVIQVLVIAIISIVSGITTSGINLALTNIGLKMAPKEGAIAYISARNVVVAIATALGPLLGGLMADRLNFQQLSRFHFENWNLIFITAAALAVVALRSLRGISEMGEIGRPIAIREMHGDFRQGIRERFARVTSQQIN